MTWESELQAAGREHWAQRARLRRAINTARLNGASWESIAQTLSYSPRQFAELDFGAPRPPVNLSRPDRKYLIDLMNWETAISVPAQKVNPNDQS
jgi:hypothetical protein